MISAGHSRETPLSKPIDAAVGTLADAMAKGWGLLDERPDLAETQARAILAAAPGHPEAQLMLALALDGQGHPQAARDLLEELAGGQPNWAAAHCELGRVRGQLGDTSGAIAALGHATGLKPDLAVAWQLLAREHRLAGDTAAADSALAKHIAVSTQDPEIMAAGAALVEGRLAVAEHGLRAILDHRPTEVAAIRMLAEVATRLGRYQDAQALLERCLELAPGFDAARMNYAVVLYRQTLAEQALAEVDLLLARDALNPGYRNLKAAALSQLGDYAQTIAIYQDLLIAYPAQPKAWMSLGHALKTVGRQGEAINAYRKSLDLAPSLGETWWSLANLKTYRFADADVATMRALLAGGGLSDEDRFHLEFSLGKALEDRREAEAAFAAYRRGNTLRRQTLDYEAIETHEHLIRNRALYNRKFFEARAEYGCDAPDPIFIVGLPRAGSTLIEQILSSHSMIEGTMELPDLPAIAKRLGGRRRKDDESDYPGVVATLDAKACRELGQSYLASTRSQRKTARPFFIDKMPNNFMHTGLLHLILPKARIIDARRHPMACGFSAYKQHFARGQAFTYDLTDLGRYYADYVALMAHFDEVLPGRAHRVIYEAMVADPKTEVRALLDYCGLDFEPACMTFYENDRAVRTASSEQVRKPIFTEGLDQWKAFEPWLEPMKSALGSVLAEYPTVPSGLA